MRPLEQMTIEQLTTTATLADYALYGGLVAIGALIGVYLIIRNGRG